jgi:hypothetical protein
MKFMVMSSPRSPRPPGGSKTPFWQWVEGEKKKGIVEAIYVRAGRGTIIVINVDSNETLHRFVSEWSSNVVAEFTVIPLVDRAVLG